MTVFVDIQQHVHHITTTLRFLARRAALIHSSIAQSKRLETLTTFKSDESTTLVASNVISRGLGAGGKFGLRMIIRT